MAYVGSPVRRKEDQRFLVGRGTFVDDVRLPGTTFAAFVRSTHAHADFAIEASKAESLPGVLRVLTARDWDASGNGDLPVIHPMNFGDGRPMNTAARRALAKDRVRHVGEAIAVVIAETEHQGLDAAEAVEITYRPLPPVVGLAEALEPGAPVVHGQFGTNLQFEREIGDRMAVQKIMDGAAHVTELQLTANRLSGNPLEPRAYLGYHAQGYSTLWTTSQIPHNIRLWLAQYTLHLPEHRIRVIAPDVGGGFGIKVEHYPEEAVVLWAAVLVGRPVRWAATRQESFLSDVHARDHVTKCRMAFSADGTIIAMSVDTIANAGAYEGTFSASIPGLAYMGPLAGLYRNRNIYARVRVAYTNTVPIEAYRGAGLGEASSVFERLIENGAREMGIDVCEIRSRNLIRPDEFPWQSPTGAVYDGGDFPGLLKKLKALARYEALRAEQARLRAKGILMGIGLSGFPELSGGAMASRRAAMMGSKSGTWEAATVRVHPSGKIVLTTGTHSEGQGHQTSFAQIAADILQCDLDDVEVVEGDTDRTPYGNGTWGDRCTIVAGTAITLAATRVVEKGKKLAAHLLECNEADLDFLAGNYVVRGTNRLIPFKDVAFQAYYGANYPASGFELGLQETAVWDPPGSVSSAAFHLAVVLLDPETGAITVRDYFAVDDPGRAINPMILDGQVEGGLAQGLGETLMEGIVYDPDTGQLLSGSFLDYAMPRAADFPRPCLERQETPARSNPLGAKGGGESGTRGPPAAVGNAVVDCLWQMGVRHVERPLTPYRMWQILAARLPADRALKY